MHTSLDLKSEDSQAAEGHSVASGEVLPVGRPARADNTALMLRACANLSNLQKAANFKPEDWFQPPHQLPQLRYWGPRHPCA